MMKIRPATMGDIIAITEIYNEAILTTTATFDTEPKSPAERTAWLQSHDERHPSSSLSLMGRSSAGRHSVNGPTVARMPIPPKPPFYVRSSHQGGGIGRQLKEAIIEEARRHNFHTIVARVAEGSTPACTSTKAPASSTSARSRKSAANS